MQKSKLNAKPVGANCIRTHFEGMTKNNQKGITLIALIITTIVMLILVGVTINVALNGGLFQKAETAKTQTQKEVEKEELTTIAIAAYDEKNKKIDQSELELGEKYSIVSDKTTEEKIVVTGQYGITWQIDVTSGKVEEYQESANSDYIKNFFLGKTTEAIQSEMKIDNEKQQATLDNGNISFIMITDGEFKGPCSLIVKNRENYYEVKINAENVANDVYNWGQECPVGIFITSLSSNGISEISLSNIAIQPAGEYKTTILIANGESDISNHTVTFSMTTITGKTLVEGEDYSFDTTTGEIVIFNLTEFVMMDIDVY